MIIEEVNSENGIVMQLKEDGDNHFENKGRWISTDE